MDVFEQLENLGNKAPSQRTDALHAIKLQLLTACESCKTRVSLNERVNNILQIRKKTAYGEQLNENNEKRFGQLANEIIEVAQQKFNITKLREKI